MRIVEFWPRGYAAEGGPGRMLISDDGDPAAKVRAVHGPIAVIFSVRPAQVRLTEPVSEAYARTMSRNDNS
jgi:hypothetical protein